MTLANDQFNPYLPASNSTDITPFLDSSFLSTLMGPQGPPGKSAMDSVGGLKINQMLDSEAQLGVLYFSIDQQALVYNDDGGQLFRLPLEKISR